MLTIVYLKNSYKRILINEVVCYEICTPPPNAKSLLFFFKMTTHFMTSEVTNFDSGYSTRPDERE